MDKFTVRKLNNLMWLSMEGDLMSIYFIGTAIWIMFSFLTSENSP